MRGENAQTVYRTERRERGFAQIPNEALRDERLSWRARGLLAYMLSFPDDWAHRADELQHHAPEGREAVRTALRELEKLGYRVRVKRRDDQGQIRTYIVLRDHPAVAQESDAEAQEPVGPLAGESVIRASLEHGNEHDQEPSSGTPSEPFGGDPIKAMADRIAREFWESRNPKPLTPFLGIRKIVETALRAHWPPRVVREGLDRVDGGISGAALERVMTKVMGTKPGAQSQRPTGPPARLDHGRLG